MRRSAQYKFIKLLLLLLLLIIISLSVNVYVKLGIGAAENNFTINLTNILSKFVKTYKSKNRLS